MQICFIKFLYIKNLIKQKCVIKKTVNKIMNRYFEINKLLSNNIEIKIIFSTRGSIENQSEDLVVDNYKMLTLGLYRRCDFNKNNKKKEVYIDKITFYSSYYDEMMLKPKKIMLINKYKDKSYNICIEDNYLFVSLMNKNFYKNLINKKTAKR